MSEPGKFPSVAAVFTTMNRAATAVACVRALAAQTRPPDLVVVADNVSSDDSVVELERLTDLPFPLRVHRMAANAGNAGGVECAMELAFGQGADAVWILDDDSWPRPLSLAALLGKPWDPAVVRHALQVDPRSGKFTWPMWVKTNRGWKLTKGGNELPPGERIPSRASWTGALISKSVRETVGPVMGELFIRGEDEEYPWRIKKHGFKFEAVTSAVMDHPGADNLVHLSFLGKNFFFEKRLADWKLYYKVRNMVWLKRRQSGDFRACLVTLAYGLASLCFDGVGRLPLIREAVADAWSGRLGKWRHHP